MKIDMVGKKYGKLTVVKEVGRDRRGIRYECECECGGIAQNVSGRDLRTGHKTSCGCRHGDRRRTHGMAGTGPYYAWGNMKKRCNNRNNPDYHSYGGRGIKYCPKWERFEGFWEDMKDGYSSDLTLDRIDVNGDYCKENCRWITLKEQENNRTNNKIINYKGKDLTLSQIADITGSNYNSIQNRLRKGISIEEAVNIPLQEQITYNGVTKSVSEFAAERGMTYHQLKKRLMRGWTVERALTQPLRKR